MGDKAAAKKAMSEANVDFKAGKYEGSIEKYTKAMELDPKEVMYPANRANVYLKMKKWEEAEKDCTDALKINSNYAKVVKGSSWLNMSHNTHIHQFIKIFLTINYFYSYVGCLK